MTHRSSLKTGDRFKIVMPLSKLGRYLVDYQVKRQLINMLQAIDKTGFCIFTFAFLLLS